MNAFTAALAREPRNGRYFLERAYSYRSLGYTYLAIDDFERAGSHGAGWAAAHNGMGMVRREKGDLTGALCRLLRNDARSGLAQTEQPKLLAGGLS